MDQQQNTQDKNQEQDKPTTFNCTPKDFAMLAQQLIQYNNLKMKPPMDLWKAYLEFCLDEDFFDSDE